MSPTTWMWKEHPSKCSVGKKRKSQGKLNWLKIKTQPMLRGNFKALNTYIRKWEMCQIYNLTSHLKKLEKEQQKISKQKEDNKEQKSIKFENKNKRKSNQKLCIFWKIKKEIGKALARLTEKKRKTQITNIRNKRGLIASNPIDVKRLIRKYYKQLCAHKFNSSDKMDQFLRTHKLQNSLKIK